MTSHTTKMTASRTMGRFLLLLSLFVFYANTEAKHSQGVPWPMPKSYKPAPQQQTLDKEAFRFVVAGNDCDILQQAFRRYYKIVFYPGWEQEPSSKQQKHQDDTVLRFESQSNTVRFSQPTRGQRGADMGVLPSLSVNVMQPCEEYPTLEMDESYTLSVATGAGKLMSKSIWGALRGLETFSQLAYEADSGMLLINNTEIDDAPRFGHRGALIDTSRHYLPKVVILQNLDALAYNKMNVFHWHIVDDQSFPYQSRILPNLSLKGAYEPYTHIYTQEDIAEIIEYARVRGIRVIPEFDTPGHTQSWGKGQAGLLTECCSGGKFNGNYGPIDPSKESSYTFLKTLFTELRSVFKDHYLHLGGDEVSFNCWKSNPNITAFMAKMNITGNYGALESYYENRLLDILNELNSGYMVWQEVVDNGCKVRSDTVVHIWLNNFEAEMDKVTKTGKRVILSNPWYLDYISYGADWKRYYAVEPLSFNGTAEQHALVMGGEMAMWCEFVDSTNIISRIWPRGSAIAERLWSPKNIKDVNAAMPRMEEHRCRMIRYSSAERTGDGWGVVHVGGDGGQYKPHLTDLVRADTVVHVWKGGDQKEMEKVIAQGYRVVLSSPWYLDYIHYGADWRSYYKVEPLNFNATEAQKALVMGGEACLWAEYVDASNFIGRMWPRASATAERLWSPASVKSTGAATPRMDEHRCRMVRRGINAEAPNGPGFCRYEPQVYYKPRV